jgi:transposase
MGKSYSADLRDRVVAFVDGGGSRRAASRHFGVSESFAVKLMQHVAKLGSSAPAQQGRPAGNGKLAAYEAFLIGVVEAKPDITMPERHVPAASTGRTHDRKQFGFKIAAPTLQTQGRPHMLRELCSLAMPSEFDLITL